MKELPHPIHSTWQYGKKTDYFSREQLLEYGKACADAAQAEAAIAQIPIHKELASYREREKTMGWNQS